MRIDPNRPLDPNALAPAALGAPKPAGDGEGVDAAPAPASAGESAGPSLDQVRQSLQAASPDRVARARALIASGQLDTPEAIQRAAQSIARFGI